VIVETEALWSELRTRLLSFLRRRVATPEDAEDLLQDVFTRIHENASTLGEVERVTSWVYRTAGNAVTDYYRRRGAFARATEALAGEPVAHLEREDSGAKEELAQCLRPLIATLPETYGQALELTELEGKTQGEAAESLGLSLSGMKSRVQRGRTKLKEVLLDCCHVEIDRRGGVVGYEPRDRARCRCTSCGGSIETGMHPRLSRLSDKEVVQIRELARRHGVENVRVFGSEARGEAGPESDIDLLIRLAPGRGFRDLMDFCDEIELALHRKVDVVVEDGLSPLIRQRVLSEAVAL
jgi:RNA polymerase sigma-70 factor (ECF subfamily)